MVTKREGLGEGGKLQAQKEASSSTLGRSLPPARLGLSHNGGSDSASPSPRRAGTLELLWESHTTTFVGRGE